MESKTLNTVYPVLFAGWGNKFGSLFAGYIFSQRLGKNLKIINLSNVHTRSDLKSIFEFNYEYINVETFKDIDNILDVNIPIYTTQRFNSNRVWFNLEQLNNHMEHIDSFLYLNHRGIQVEHEDVISFYKNFKIEKNVKKEIKDFIDKNSLDKNTIGIHIRAADHPDRSYNIEYARQFIKSNLDKKIFICTEEKEVETELCQYKNVFCRQKTQYSEKVNKDKSWNATHINPETNANCTNIVRTTESSKEGFIDMILLSRSNLNFNSKIRTSFLKWARMFSNLDLNEM